MDQFLEKFIKQRPPFYLFIRPKELSLLYEFFINIPESKGKIKVLDYGCGDGFFTSVLWDSLPDELKNRMELTGVDIAEDILTDAKQLSIYQTLVKFDGQTLPFDDNTFDLVFSNSVLEHVEHLQRNIKEVFRVTKKGGHFISTQMTANWENNLFGKLLFGDAYKKWMRKKQVHINLLSPNKWVQLFEKEGFALKTANYYLGPSHSRLMDVFHYVSIPSLISKKIFGKWVLCPWIYSLFPLQKLFRGAATHEVSQDKASSMYVELTK